LGVATFAATVGARAALATVLVAGLVLVAWAPRSGWVRPALLAAVLLLAAGLTGVRYEAANDRVVSADTLAVAVRSVAGDVGARGLDATRAWRLAWWGEVVDDTLWGPYRWTGKGFGVNLADVDGFQVHADRSLRSPHNVTVTFLARGGVPGVLLWTAFGVGLLAALAAAARARRREAAGGDPTAHAWAVLNATVGIYLVAFLVNASLDVYLEGPPGGIWFWSVVGVALAALRLQATPDRRRS
jgi:O-antigen ligase